MLRVASLPLPALPLLLLLLSVLLPGPSRGYFPEERWSPESPLLAPRVVIALACRNSAHSLPLFLGALERLAFSSDVHSAVSRLRPPHPQNSPWWGTCGGQSLINP